MNRRTVLAGAAFSLLSVSSGCLGDDERSDSTGSGESSETNESSETDEQSNNNCENELHERNRENQDDKDDDESAFARIVTVEPDPAPDINLKPSVSIATETATETGPASVTISWENVGDDSVVLGEAREALFFVAHSDNEDALLLAFEHLGDVNEVVQFDECWQAATPGYDDLYETVTLDPCEIHGTEAKLYSSGDHCLGSGSYRFETAITVEDPNDSGDRTTETWGFTLELSASE